MSFVMCKAWGGDLKAKAHHKLEHVILSSGKKKKFHFPLVIAVSGGRDSMALLSAMIRIYGKEKLVVAHFHHGEEVNQKFRNQAYDLVYTFCKKQNISLEMGKAQEVLASEAEFRRARNVFLSQIAKKHNTSVVVMAHHMDDWLETQLIKLIRGCSFASLNQNLEWSLSQKLWKWRPWIQVPRLEIEQYVQDNKVPFVEDPSNQETCYLRNWLRNQWLKDLNEYRPGSSQSLAHSLIHSLEALKAHKPKFPWNAENSSISRLYWESLSVGEKKQCLAYFFYKKKWPSIKRTQIEEIVKQLDKNQNELTLSFKTFEVLVNAEQVVITQKKSF